MAPLAVAAFAVVAGYWTLLRQSQRGRGSAPFLLTALPIATLMLIAPVPLVALQTIAAFKEAGVTGHPSMSVTELALGIVRPLWFGSLGFVVALGAAGVIQVLGMDDAEQVEEAAPDAAVRRPAWPTWILLASPLVIVPTGLVIHLTAGIAPLIVQAGAAVARTGPEPRIAGPDLAHLSQMLTARLVLGVLGGFGTLGFALVCAVASILAHRFSTKSDAFGRLSNRVMALVGIFCLWNLVALTITIRALAP